MKRLLIAVAGAAMICGLGACSNDSDPAPATSSTSTPATTTSTTAPAGSTTAPVQPTTGGRGADGSTGNNLSSEYCAKNQDPGCPAGSYIGPNAIPSPNGDGTWVPCEGTVCTNPNHGAGPDGTVPPVEPTTTVPPATTTQPAAERVEGAPCEGDGRWVHLEGGNADHYGTEWLCQH
ncbi:hypothetical protein [Nocardia sp. NPDC058480]|uniref:hypothetical protein n=1 Tax=unclassified Nocardia TaxID=2637762 RepID=UPI003663B642